jgi:hypothetical protein
MGAGPSRPPGPMVDASFRVCFDPAMETTGTVYTVLLDPFWASRRADQFDQVCR